MRFAATAGLVMILSGVGAYYATGADELSPFSWMNLLAGTLLLLLGAGIAVRNFQGFTGAVSRAVALRWSAIGAAVLAVLILLNYWGRNWQAMLDLTSEGRYSLSDQTLVLCNELSRSSIQPKLLFLEDSLMARDVRLLIQAYQADCSSLKVERLRSQDAPREARTVLAQYETSVLTCTEGRCEPVGFPSEENITNALLRLGRERQINVQFLVGHGEANFASPAADGFSGLAGILRDAGLTLGAFVGPSQTRVPEGTQLLVIVAPERNLLEPEIEAFDRYLRGGGRLLALLEPDRRTNLNQLLERWGFEIPEGIVLDPASSPLLDDPRAISLLVNSFNSFHPATRKFSNRTMLLMPGAQPVIPRRKPEPDDDLRALAYSSPRAWITDDIQAALADRLAAPLAPSQEEFPLAAAGRYPRGDVEARIVAIGDQDFASNRHLGQLYNRDLILNAVLWLVEDEQHIAIRPKAWTPDQDPLTLQQTLAYFYFLAFALPEVLLLLGIHAWYRQRGG